MASWTITTFALAILSALFAFAGITEGGAVYAKLLFVFFIGAFLFTCFKQQVNWGTFGWERTFY